MRCQNKNTRAPEKTERKKLAKRETWLEYEAVAALLVVRCCVAALLVVSCCVAVVDDAVTPASAGGVLDDALFSAGVEYFCGVEPLKYGPLNLERQDALSVC
jgi:hypothetical protein